MIEFQELRITPDSKCLIIDVSIKDLSYYNNVYLDAVIIDNQDTFTANGPSTNPLFTYEVSTDLNTIYSLPENNSCNPVEVNEEGAICFTSADSGKKRIRLELNSTSLGTSLCNNLFFVYIVTKGTPSPDTPCGMDNDTTLAVVANLYPFYRVAVNYMKEVEDNCSISKNFIDYILRFYSLELSIKTGHYTQAIKYWNKFFKEVPINNSNTRCKCYG